MYGPGSNGDEICISSALRAAAPTVRYAYASDDPSLPGGATLWSSLPTVLTYILVLDSVDWLSTYSLVTACRSVIPLGPETPAKSPG